MFKTFFFADLKYSLKAPMVHIFFILMALLTFGATVSDSIQIGGSIGNVYKNSPHVITVFTSIMSIFGILIATAFFNNAALKDQSNNFNEILFSTPLSKSGYYFGRFFSALLLSTIPLLGVFFGIFLGAKLGPLFGWISTDRIGDFYLETFINNYFLFILPNMFFAGAVIFSLALKFKSTVISFVGSLIIIIAYIIAGTLVSDIDNETLGALTDIFGIRTYSIYSKYFTPIEKNTISPSFSGLLLMNRFIWSSLGIIFLSISYYSFSFQEKNKKVKNNKKEVIKKNSSFSLPILNPVFNNNTNWKQFKSFFKINFLSITKSVTFKILFLFSAIILISNLLSGFEYFGLKSYPLTYKMINLVGSVTSLFVVIILVFFSGELIWRDRDSKINEVIDSTPHLSIISLSAKALSLICIASLLNVFFIFIAVIYQLINGFTRIELDVYFIDFIYTNLAMYVTWSGIMIMIQVLLNNKYIGYFFSILVIFIWNIILSVFHLESNMINFGSAPTIRYSDINGFGPGFLGATWFNIYWLLFSLLCLLIAAALWNRGVLSPFYERLKNIRKQVPKSFKYLTLFVFILWLGVTSFVYYNTQILNPYKNSKENELFSVALEKKYKKYEHVNLPKIIDVKYKIDIYPEDRNTNIISTILLKNESNKAIDSLHFLNGEDWKIKIDIPQSNLIYNDEKFHYQIFKLNNKMLPNDSIEIKISSDFITKGFGNSRGSTKVVKNGTFFNNFDFLPSLGYTPQVELSSKNKRKKYGLAEKERMPKLQENCTKACMSNYLSEGKSDFINLETIISTAEDQIAVAPGSLIKSWNEKGRNYYHYKVDHISQHFVSFISGKFEVAKRKWNGIDLEVYYDKKHAVNVEMMLDAMERSLAYYIENFGPYYHHQCRIIEFPNYATFAQAFPGTMPYSESFGFTANLEDESKNNVIDAVIAHEIAHQWWAHQVVGANMQGASMFSESFAEYSSLMTMKSITKNPMKIRDFLKYDHNRYLRGRGTEVSEELPLFLVENQQYIHYGKGAVVLFALQDYIGEDKVNLAMKNFLEAYKYQKPPYPTSLDFLSYLEPQVPDSLKYLVKDWFKEITLFDNRMKETSYKIMDNGKYEVTMKIEANKLKSDSIGNQTKVAINDWIDLGIFSDKEEKHLMFQKRVKINKNKMTFTFVVDSLPIRAGIDPRMVLIDRVFDDNIKNVVVE